MMCCGFAHCFLLLLAVVCYDVTTGQKLASIEWTRKGNKMVSSRFDQQTWHDAQTICSLLNAKLLIDSDEKVHKFLSSK